MLSLKQSGSTAKIDTVVKEYIDMFKKSINGFLVKSIYSKYHQLYFDHKYSFNNIVMENIDTNYERNNNDIIKYQNKLMSNIKSPETGIFLYNRCDWHSDHLPSGGSSGVGIMIIMTNYCNIHYINYEGSSYSMGPSYWIKRNDVVSYDTILPSFFQKMIQLFNDSLIIKKYYKHNDTTTYKYEKLNDPVLFIQNIVNIYLQNSRFIFSYPELRLKYKNQKCNNDKVQHEIDLAIEKISLSVDITTYDQLKNHNSELKTKLLLLKPTIDLHKQYVQIKQEVDDLTSKYNAIKNLKMKLVSSLPKGYTMIKL